MLIFSTIDIFFFNEPATTEIYTLSLHDALPISFATDRRQRDRDVEVVAIGVEGQIIGLGAWSSLLQQRSEEHTSELQSHVNLVCRLLLEKKKKTILKYRIKINSAVSHAVSHI